jgi:hypothetical protein
MRYIEIMAKGQSPAGSDKSAIITALQKRAPMSLQPSSLSNRCAGVLLVFAARVAATRMFTK